MTRLRLTKVVYLGSFRSQDCTSRDSDPRDRREAKSGRCPAKVSLMTIISPSFSLISTSLWKYRNAQDVVFLLVSIVQVRRMQPPFLPLPCPAFIPLKTAHPSTCQLASVRPFPLLSCCLLTSACSRTKDAQATVKAHIKLLHDYNEIRDVGQGLMGIIADNRGVRAIDVYRDFDVGEGD